MKNRLMWALKDKSVLITGASGFIGSFLARAIKPLCRKAGVYKGDVRDIAGYRERYDILCHLAALNKSENEKSKIAEMFDVNVSGTAAVMRYCRRNGAGCIFASSSAVYKPAISFKRIGEDSVTQPVSLYGISKMLAERVCEACSENSGIRVAALRIFNIYGPGQKEPFLIPYLINRARSGKPVDLKTPMAMRDFVYISDVVNAFILACGHTWRNFIALNVGSGRGVSVHDTARKIVRIANARPVFSGKINTGPDADYVISDISNISKVLNWRPSITLENGLKIMCAKNKIRL